MLQNGGETTFNYRSAVARLALTDPPEGVNISPNSFNTTEIHCTEYYGGTTAGQHLASKSQFSDCICAHLPPPVLYCFMHKHRSDSWAESTTMSNQFSATIPVYPSILALIGKELGSSFAASLALLS